MSHHLSALLGKGLSLSCKQLHLPWVSKASISLRISNLRTNQSGTISAPTGDYALVDFIVNLGGNPTLDAVYQGQVGSTQGYLSSGEVAPVPEPSRLLLFGSGMVGIAGLLRRKLNF